MKSIQPRSHRGLLQASLLTILALSSSLSSATVRSERAAPLEPMAIHRQTTRNIVDALASRHYIATRLDDDLSDRIYQAYIIDLDPSKSYLLADDIALFEVNRFEMDNALRKGNLSPAFDIFNRYHGRVIARFQNIIAMLEEGVDQFDFSIDETLELDREDAAWAVNEEELDDLWRKRIKNAVLNLMLSDKEQEKIQELLLKRYKNRLTRTLQTNSEDVYQLYMNSFTKTYDPHTQYFSPRTSENFNINMSLSLEGIGAVLQLEDEYTKVVSLVPAGPAAKSKQISPDDRIIAVGQDKHGEMVDVIGWRLDEVVQLIRGKKGTIVRLDIIPAADKNGSQSRIIHITRNKVKLEEQSAKSEIIEIEQFGHTRKIGVIDIPTFYIDFKALQQHDRNYKSTTRDVKNLLIDLIAEGVDGVVIDLRDNGGGSLQEAKTLTGLFIDRGPTVQIRSKSNRLDILNDTDISTTYDGPLAILVNRLSASASEIFAGAIQDYERGLIIGSQTFGKGTVQSLQPLNRGQLKLTQAKFYRISGESTQHRGIIPDIAYPSNYDPESIGESTLDNPLPWDEILPTGFRSKNAIDNHLEELISLHQERVKVDADFTYLKEAIAYRKTRSLETRVSLNEKTRKEKKQTSDDFWLALENKKRVAQGKAMIDSLDDLDNDEPAVAAAPKPSSGIAPAAESAEGSDELTGNEMAVVVETPILVETPLLESDSFEDVEKDEKKAPDAYLIETRNILLDLISMKHRTAAKASGKKST
ncbi:MAG: carboxy terminal-processing peptidase [Pseudomonadales bacterium]